MRHLPNILTAARIALALIFPFVDARGRLPIVALALLTEYLDGAISRLCGTTSRLGQVLDPIADKLFFAAVAFVFIREGSLTILDFAWLGARDLFVLAAVLWALARGKRGLIGEMKPLVLGKVVTVFQYFVCFEEQLTGSMHRGLFYATAALRKKAAL